MIKVKAHPAIEILIAMSINKYYKTVKAIVLVL